MSLFYFWDFVHSMKYPQFICLVPYCFYKQYVPSTESLFIFVWPWITFVTTFVMCDRIEQIPYLREPLLFMPNAKRITALLQHSKTQITNPIVFLEMNMWSWKLPNNYTKLDIIQLRKFWPIIQHHINVSVAQSFCNNSWLIYSFCEMCQGNLN